MSARPASLAEWRSSGRSFSFRSHEIFFQRAGHGVPLLLVHGFPTAGWDHYKLWPQLIETYDVIAPDLLGFGFSAKPRGHAYDVQEQAELCLALLRALGVERCHLLCHDYGVLDPVSGEHMVRRLLELKPEADVVRLSVGHYPQVEAPEQVLAAWQAFAAA